MRVLVVRVLVVRRSRSKSPGVSNHLKWLWQDPPPQYTRISVHPGLNVLKLSG